MTRGSWRPDPQVLVATMAALRVKRGWWGRRQEPASDMPLFRELARRWKPVVRVEHTPVPLRVAIPTNDVPAPSRDSFAPKQRSLFAAERARPTRSWNPWLWMK